MPLPDAAIAFYDRQKALSLAVVTASQAQWRLVDPADLDGSWQTISRRIQALVAAGQLAAARDSVAYVPQCATEVGLDGQPVAEVDPAAWSGVTSDGRPLDGLLVGGVVDAKTRIGAGTAVEQALALAGIYLGGLIATQLADASRQATSAAITAAPGIPGYVRMLRLPSCSRCAVMAGAFYRWNKGFQRHPRCDCRHIPASEDDAADLRTDPRAAIESGQVTGLSKADRAAIGEGADVSRVVNRKGLTNAGYLRDTGRPSVEDIYRRAGSREQAIEGLRRAGYITGRR